MSYTNPKIFASDPTAFSRGFDVAFQKQQQAFQADIEERKKLAKEADDAMAAAYSMADVGAIKGIDLKFNEALQNSLNSIVESGDFANASAAGKAKMIQEMRLKKAAFQRIGEIVGVENEDWDMRNDPTLTAFRTAVIKGEDVSIDSKGLDFKIKGSFGEITLDDIANKRIFNKAPYEENLDEINQKYAKSYAAKIYTAFKNGKSQKDIDEITALEKAAYAQAINKEPDLKSYVQYNVAQTKDDTEMIDTLFNSVVSLVTPPELQFNQPKPDEPKKPKLLGLDDQQREVGLSNIINLEESKIDENNEYTETSPYFEIRMKGPNDVVAENYRFRKRNGKYFLLKKGIGLQKEISEQDLFNLFGYSEEYKKYKQQYELPVIKPAFGPKTFDQYKVQK